MWSYKKQKRGLYMYYDWQHPIESVRYENETTAVHLNDCHALTGNIILPLFFVAILFYTAKCHAGILFNKNEYLNKISCFSFFFFFNIVIKSKLYFNGLTFFLHHRFSPVISPLSNENSPISFTTFDQHCSLTFGYV